VGWTKEIWLNSKPYWKNTVFSVPKYSVHPIYMLAKVLDIVGKNQMMEKPKNGGEK
jgi:hypothetical protein